MATGPYGDQTAMDRRGRHPPTGNRTAPVVTGGILLCGVWLLLAPFLWGYDATGAASVALWNDLTAGVVVVLCGLARTIRMTRTMVNVACLLAGVWIAIAPFALSYGATTAYPTASINDVVVGTGLTALALVGLGTADRGG